MKARTHLTVEDPFRGTTVAEVGLASPETAREAVRSAARAQLAWGRSPLGERIGLCLAALQALEDHLEDAAREVTVQMGKPIAQARQEVRTCLARGRHMASIAEEALSPRSLPGAGGERRITREPVGVVLDIAAWNYPLLIAVNVVVPAVLAGNSVVLKHASRTPLCGSRFEAAFRQAGAPAGLVTALHADHEAVEAALSMDEIGYVTFTGSVRGGHEIYRSAARRFIDAGLELGGKDPAYVAEDADVNHAVENLADGAFYNAGQSCCGVERIYVARPIYEHFVEGLVARAAAYRLDDPLDEATTMGPMADPAAGAFLLGQVKEARALGGEILCGGQAAEAGGCRRFFSPTVVGNATHAMGIMREESFGPVVGVAPVESDQEAIERMNDSRYGLTASIWTRDPTRARRVGEEVRTGTFFMNRCDWLDPGLAWTGVKDSGKGVSLSALGFLPLTRPKSWNLVHSS
ncbi:aldehyde dehydrogenase family protein [Vulgatibacter incomptus]|uniref:Aldehyde dehydrogenase n=1 Tax=Vulgatibacter incomptus TaxID=1391653 RepID=A0A0K1P9F8_9BACT|nr:aldehyde dehydrogenase family protein [Vulgatibacter incomptus]AKU89719.1 Aldehyde dehydrogenase [Vulgatibacter incomptus]